PPGTPRVLPLSPTRRSSDLDRGEEREAVLVDVRDREPDLVDVPDDREERAVAASDARDRRAEAVGRDLREGRGCVAPNARGLVLDRKSTRLNSSHQIISYAV